MLELVFRFVLQLNERFSEQTSNLFKLFEIFDHSSPNFFNPESHYLKLFISQYNYFKFNELQIASEFPSAKSLFDDKDNVDLDAIAICLKNFPIAFTETLKIISLVKTLPITTATNERFFSSLKNVKSYLRTTMGDERLNNLMVLNVEKEHANNINLEEAVDRFAKLKNRRYPLV